MVVRYLIVFRGERVPSEVSGQVRRKGGGGDVWGLLLNVVQGSGGYGGQAVARGKV